MYTSSKVPTPPQSVMPARVTAPAPVAWSHDAMLSQDTWVESALNDVASSIRQALGSGVAGRPDSGGNGDAEHLAFYGDKILSLAISNVLRAEQGAALGTAAFMSIGAMSEVGPSPLDFVNVCAYS